MRLDYRGVISAAGWATEKVLVPILRDAAHRAAPQDEVLLLHGPSCAEPVEEPFGGIVRAVAEQPEAAAVVVLDAVVVAHRRDDVGGHHAAVGARPPPFVGGALWPLDLHHHRGVGAPLVRARR